jgi:hypothetical protein
MARILFIHGFCPLKKGYKGYKRLLSYVEQFGSVSCVEYNDADYIEDIATRLEHLITSNTYSHIICNGTAGSLMLHLMRQRRCDFERSTIVFCQGSVQPLHEMSKFSITIPFRMKFPTFGRSMTVSHMTNVSFTMPSDFTNVLKHYRKNRIVIIYSCDYEVMDQAILHSLDKWRNHHNNIFIHTRSLRRTIYRVFRTHSIH